MLFLPDKYQQLWDNFPTICNELKVELCQFLLDTEQTHYNEFIENTVTTSWKKVTATMCQ